MFRSRCSWFNVATAALVCELAEHRQIWLAQQLQPYAVSRAIVARRGARAEPRAGISYEIAVGTVVRAERRVAREAELDSIRGRTLLVLLTDGPADIIGGLRRNHAGLEQRTAPVRQWQVRCARR